MFVLGNVAAGNDFHKEAVLTNLLPARKEELSPSLLKLLRSGDSLLRTAAVWCIVNLTYPDCPGSSARVSRLRDAGIISQLKAMVDDSCLDVKVFYFSISSGLTTWRRPLVLSFSDDWRDSSAQFRARTALGQCTIAEQNAA